MKQEDATGTRSSIGTAKSTRNRSPRSRTGSQRSNTGSTLIGGTLACLGFVAIASPILIFFANVSVSLTLHDRMSAIAEQTSSVVDDYRYWLGLPRPGFDERQARETAAEAARVMCEDSGLKDVHASIHFVTEPDGSEVTVCDLQADARQLMPSRANIFGFDMATFFNGQLKSRGVRRHSLSHRPYSVIHMDAPTVEDQSHTRPLGLNRRDVAVLPAFGFFNNMAAGDPGSIATPYGKGISKMAPENFFAMNHYHLKKSDIEHVQTTGNEVANNGWHPKRLIDGEKQTFQ